MRLSGSCTKQAWKQGKTTLYYFFINYFYEKMFDQYLMVSFLDLQLTGYNGRGPAQCSPDYIG
jgi:hypothetical protein